MTATTRMTECSVSAATLYLAFELGSTKWTLGFTPAPAQRPRVRTIAAGDLRALEQELSAAKARFGLALETPVRSCYEAGRDGFWLHRWLLDQGVANVVVDSSSIEVNRKARRAKTDRLDVRIRQLKSHRAFGARHRAVDEQQAVGFFIGQRPQQQAVDDAEDRSVGPDPERQRDDRNQRKAGRCQEQPHGVTHVSNHISMHRRILHANRPHDRVTRQVPGTKRVSGFT